jgi:hypothetical protein
MVSPDELDFIVSLITVGGCLFAAIFLFFGEGTLASYTSILAECRR